MPGDVGACRERARPSPECQLTLKRRWGIIAAGITAGIVGYCAWLILTDAPAYRFLVRLYVDRYFLKQTLREWGVLAPIIFILLQALQVVIAPIPGEVTGILGGYLGGWVDSLLMRITDISLAFPFILIGFLLAVILGPSVTTVVLAISLLGWRIDSSTCSRVCECPIIVRSGPMARPRPSSI